ncbi:hypothetical protein VM1G_03044 [Cytospora mali]|uniref:SET domain-containing protein n=1 Tax=Cytospora mali TaxID=578113 RepID=A0A194VTA4_CYTMA|nr:hypothetical protein VM1G_03044 [Valsa mali]
MCLLHLASAWLPFLLLLVQVRALIHEQVAFDNSDVCWWSLVPPDLICPVLTQQNLTEIVHSLIRPYQWDGGKDCAGIYCLYSNRGFAGGRGIAVITTPENAMRVKQVGDLLQEYEVSFSNDKDTLPFHIDGIEGKGEGIVARQRLARGDTIMAHTPVLLVHRAFTQELAQYTQQDLLELAVQSLPDQTAEVFMEHLSRIPGQRRIAAILTTKAFQVDLTGEDGHHYGVFPEAARLSHHCRPNAAFYVDSSTLMHVTTAVQPVMPGEELTFSYLDPFASLAHRQEKAQLAWGSGCGCSQCTLSVEEATESDTRLREIRWIEGQLGDFNSAEDVSVGIITYLLRLYENERLQCCMAGAYTLAALNFNSLGYDKRAVKYAGLAIEALRIEKGEGAPDVRVMEDLIRDPRGHNTFAVRVKGARK